MSQERLAAARALARVSSGGYSNIVLDAELRRAKLPAREAAFASALFYGVLERRVTLDKLIAGYSAQPPEKLEPEVLDALRIGFYQLAYMDSVPDRAAVNESVELCRALGKERAAGFVNGILRAFIRAGKPVDFSRLRGTARLSAEYSMPEWLCDKWRREYGDEAAKKALSASIGVPPLFVRVNTLRVSAAELIDRLSREGVEAEPVEGFPSALRVRAAAAHNTECYKAGLFHIQDVSSQLAAEALGAAGSCRVFDPCAAPGGKSFTIAELLGGAGEVLAADLYPKRAAMVEQGAARLGLTNIKAFASDAAKFDPALGLFDFVLCDAPCSGLGVLRRKPEIGFKRPQDMEDLPGVQYKIASASARYLKKGGVLLYSTCTLSKAENEGVARRLAAEAGLVPARLPERAAIYSEDGCSATLLPGEFGNDGFYFARFIRE